MYCASSRDNSVLTIFIIFFIQKYLQQQHKNETESTTAAGVRFIFVRVFIGR